LYIFIKLVEETAAKTCVETVRHALRALAMWVEGEGVRRRD
jgi:hypothetical protein